jgi:hypothetical protein
MTFMSSEVLLVVLAVAEMATLSSDSVVVVVVSPAGVAMVSSSVVLLLLLLVVTVVVSAVGVAKVSSGIVTVFVSRSASVSGTCCREVVGDGQGTAEATGTRITNSHLTQIVSIAQQTLLQSVHSEAEHSLDLCCAKLEQ